MRTATVACYALLVALAAAPARACPFLARRALRQQDAEDVAVGLDPAYCAATAGAPPEFTQSSMCEVRARARRSARRSPPGAPL